MYKFSQRSKDRRVGIDQRLIEISDLAIKITVVDFGIPTHGGLRTAVDQNKIYLSGASNADGYNNLSDHQMGRALDFYAYVDPAASWKPLHLAMVAAAHLQAASLLGYKLKWSGHWKSFKELCHVYLVD